MLSRNYRLTKQNVGRVFKKGRGVSGAFLRIKFMQNRTDHPRFSITCSNKVAPKAVTRNRLRRKTYTILAEIMPKVNFDIAINYQKLPNETHIKPALLDIFKKSGII
jgi:ribonuclease P protein component